MTLLLYLVGTGLAAFVFLNAFAVSVGIKAERKALEEIATPLTSRDQSSPSPADPAPSPA